MNEQFIIFAIVAAAGLYLGRNVLNLFRGRAGCGHGCGGCAGNKAPQLMAIQPLKTPRD